MHLEEKLLPECPFYVGEDYLSIGCEGLNKDHHLQLRFKRRMKLNAHREAYCCSMNYENCPIGKMLYQNYEDHAYD